MMADDFFFAENPNYNHVFICNLSPVNCWYKCAAEGLDRDKRIRSSDHIKM